jgi:hypothetical protein
MDDHTPSRASNGTFEEVMSAALGFDIEAELEYCKQLTMEGGAGTVSRVFDPQRAVRLFQGLLWTGRYQSMGEDWKQGIESGLEQGVLARPEWN